MCHAQFMYMIEEKAKCMNIVCKTYTSVDRMHENHAYKKNVCKICVISNHIFTCV